VIALRFVETVPQKNLRALAPATLARTWLAIVRNPTFLAFSALSTASYAGLFTFLASSSFVFIKVLGLGKTHYGLLMFSMAFTYLLGTFLCRRLLPRFGVRRTVAIAGALTLTGGTLMGVLALSGMHSPWPSCCRFTCSCWAMASTSPVAKVGPSGRFHRPPVQPRH
jgi:DHA1 family bicyclomycin/chloramphenicol resistance-like MFS transporter